MQLNAILDQITEQVKKLGFEKIHLGYYKKLGSKEPVKFLEERTFRRIRRLDEVLYTEKTSQIKRLMRGQVLEIIQSRKIHKFVVKWAILRLIWGNMVKIPQKRASQTLMGQGV